MARTVVKWNTVEEPVLNRSLNCARFVTIKFVVEASPSTAKFVVVAEVPVAETKVKFCNVEEPNDKRFNAVTVPVATMFATLAIFPLISSPPCTESFCDGLVVPIPTN